MTAVAFLLALWLLVCLVLLAHCLRTKGLLPLFGSRRLARVVWATSFLLVNPLLVVLYALVASGRGFRIARERVRDGVAVGGFLVAAWLQFGIGHWSLELVDVKQTAAASSSSLSLNFRSCHISAPVGAMIAEQELPVASRTIRVIASEDALSGAIAARVAEALAAEWWTEVVELWPRGHRAEEGARAPDYYIDIDAGAVWGTALPPYSTLHGRISFSGSIQPSPVGPGAGEQDDRIRQGLLKVEGSITLAFHRLGSALGAARYGEPAQAVARQIERSLIDPLRERADTCGQVVDSPLAFRPRATSMPAALEAVGATLLDREHARYLHDRARYRFEDSRPTKLVLDELGRALAADGWQHTRVHADHGACTTISARRDRARLTIGRWPAPEWVSVITSVNGEAVPRPPEPPCSTPFIATLTEPLDDDELRAAAADYARDPVNVAGLLALRETLEDDQLECLREEMYADPIPQAGLWMMLAKLDQGSGDLYSAASALRIADAISQVEGDVSLEDEVEELAQELEVELDDGPPTIELLRAAGYRVLTPEGAPVDLTLAHGECARFAVLADGDPPAFWSISLGAIEPRITLWCTSKSGGSSAWGEEQADGSDIPGRGGRTFQVDGEVGGGRARLRARCVR